MHKARAIMAANHGLITRAQALDAGLSPSTIRHLVNTGRLVILRRGVYADGELWRSLDVHRGQHRLRTRAALATMRRSWVVSHDSSAYEQELEILAPPDPHVHITRPGFTSAWTEFGVKHHLARFRAEQVVRVNGLPALDLARTAVDIAREHGTPYGEVACDSAMRRGVSKAALEAACEPMWSWPHIVRTRDAVDFARPRTGSVVETLGRLLVTELGVDAPIEIQFPVRRPDGRVAWLDIVLGCHGFEVDGKSKYVPTEQGGLASKHPMKSSGMRSAESVTCTGSASAPHGSSSRTTGETGERRRSDECVRSTTTPPTASGPSFPNDCCVRLVSSAARPAPDPLAGRPRSCN